MPRPRAPWRPLPPSGPHCRLPPRPRTADQKKGSLFLSDHFRFAVHPEHGYVAEVGSPFPGHLADWLLTREQFEPIPGAAGLYRLTTAERDGQRRARQAVHDLRRLGFRVHADASLDPPAPPRPVQDRGMHERRSRLAQAAARSSPQIGPARATSVPPVQPDPAAHVPTVHPPRSPGKGPLSRSLTHFG